MVDRMTRLEEDVIVLEASNVELTKEVNGLISNQEIMVNGLNCAMLRISQMEEHINGNS